MESEQRLAAREPMAVDLENEDLANTCQIPKKTDTVDATDVLPMEIEYGSPEAEEVPEESSGDPIREVSIQTSVLEENRIVEYSDNINNEEGTNPEPDARRKNRVLQKLTQAPRYFDPPECEEYNRGKKRKAKKKRKPCYICGDIGHQGERCKKVNNCSICSKKGNLVKDSPDKNVEVDCTSRLCLICGNTGHDMFSCTNNYDPEDLKAIECYVCQKAGHLCCVENKTEGPREVSCYNCGESGHFGSDCAKSNEVANDQQQLCSKCTKETSAKTVMKKDAAAAKAAKRKARKARRWKKTKAMPTVDAYQGQPSMWWGPPIMGPYYGKPGSNVWLSPAAAAARTGLNHQIEALPSRQPIYHCQVGGNQVLTQLPDLDGSSQNETQIPKLPLNQETGTMLPQTETGTQVQQKPFDPMSHLPHLIWNSKKDAQIPQPHQNHQSGVLLPQTESRFPQNSSGLPPHLPRLICNGGQRSPSDPTAALLRQAGTQIKILLPHQIFNRQTLLPCENQNTQTGDQN